MTQDKETLREALKRIFLEYRYQAMLTAFQQKNSECPSCGGLNISCPDGCGRNPITGELNFSRLENSDER